MRKSIRLNILRSFGDEHDHWHLLLTYKNYFCSALLICGRVMFITSCNPITNWINHLNGSINHVASTLFRVHISQQMHAHNIILPKALALRIIQKLMKFKERSSVCMRTKEINWRLAYNEWNGRLFQLSKLQEACVIKHTIKSFDGRIAILLQGSDQSLWFTKLGATGRLIGQ